ncbi:cytoskeletal protein RodZ [Nocardioides albertanoniae]|uniref:Cytoskeletal protein RodZ n=1 Tax=Nocardioides albertanoniae TaxID=1175486 RepID=A0A543A644_9ACTN|nr:helix-turn-helix domain-containing protein [Nocardioides albertanoniae]TQL68054.1 cytoskeletal protein RodZ [Nocardioides albertanoniae]
MSENSPAVEPVETAEPVAPADVDVVEVRRNGRLALVVASASLLVGLAFVLRGGIEGYLLGLLLLAVAVVQGWTAWDSRLPLLLVDEQGVRLRFGQTWQGIPWSKIEAVEHTPRPAGIERFWKDGRIGVLLHDEEAVLAELSPTARRQAMLTQRLYGLPFSLPLGLSTHVLGGGDDVTDAIAYVAADGVEVVEIDPGLDAGPETDTEADTETDTETGTGAGTEATASETADETPDGEDGSALAGDGDTSVRLPAVGRGGDTNPRMLRVLDEPDINAADVVDEAEQDQVERSAEHDETTPRADADPEVTAEVKPQRAEPVAPLREPSAAVRVDVRYVPEEPQDSIAVHGANALQLDPVDTDDTDAEADAPVVAARPEAEEIDADDQTHVFVVDSDATEQIDLSEGVSLAAEPDESVEKITFDGVGGQAAAARTANPEIGAEISAARHRLGLDAEALAEWTRIRPHVIEAIEVDDFGPCGGDFYARGHLRTLARVLGIDVAPLLRTYDEKFASGPVSARTVFEAELAHSAAVRPVRRMRGGPSWSVLVAAVMAVILVWSVARLVIDGTQHEPEAGAIQLDGSAGTDNPYGDSSPVPVVISAAGGGAHVVVRDSRGKVVFSGDLAFGESKSLRVTPPLRVQTSDGSLKVSVGDSKAKALGKTGEPAQHTYTAK